MEQDHIGIKKFNGENFYIWKFRMLAKIGIYDRMINGTCPYPEHGTDEEKEKWRYWDFYVLHLIVASLEDTQLFPLP